MAEPNSGDGRTGLRLPRRESLLKTSSEDPRNRYFLPVLRRFYLARLELAAAALPSSGGRVLDAGYGCGILFPELASRFSHVVGLDLHSMGRRVAETAGDLSAGLSLTRGDLASLPFADGAFECVLMISVVGYVEDLRGCLAEAKRVTRPGGAVIVSFPSILWYTRPFVRYYRGRRTHADIVAAVDSLFGTVEWTWFPRWLPRSASPFLTAACRKE